MFVSFLLRAISSLSIIHLILQRVNLSDIFKYIYTCETEVCNVSEKLLVFTKLPAIHIFTFIEFTENSSIY